MNRIFLMAAVSAIAMAAPAQADKGGKHANPDQAAQQPQPAQQPQSAQQPQQPQGNSRGGGGGGGHQQRQQQTPQMQQAPPMQQRAQRSFDNRGGGGDMQRFEQRARPQQQVFQQRARPERQVFQQQRMERVARPQRQVVEQRAPRIDNRMIRQQQVQAERANGQNRVEQQVQAQRQAPATDWRGRQSMQRSQMGDRTFRQQVKQQQQAERFAQAKQRDDRRTAMVDKWAMQRAQFDGARREQWSPRPQAAVGQRLTLQAQTPDWYGDYAAQRYSAFNTDASNSYYNYNSNDGYLYQLNRSNNLVTGLFPLLGGAFGAGQLLPTGYQNYNVPYGYQSLYYDTPDYNYRYGDGAIYRVDPDTQMIQAVVALLTGQNFGIGQQLPLGYDVYNVPYAYRDQYADTADNWYRYDDGTIYQVDPYSRMIEGAYPVSYGGYQVGYPAPNYAGYGYPSYSVPYAYDDLYYGQPGYDYQYANGGIYQVDPTSQLVSALVALVTGQNLGVGQMLPSGYDAYNVPYAYRSSYADTANTMYRYDDGYIYGANPRTRVIETAFPVAYDGFAVGYPVPADYPGYAVPQLYSNLYYAQPGYDYRYADGGIYQIDPKTRMVEAIAALLTGQNFGVGQMLPAGYDAYNVPYAYRGQYADNADNWYRYADGNIYQVDPQTRVIRTVVTIA